MYALRRLCVTEAGENGGGALQEPPSVLFWASENSAQLLGSHRLWVKSELSGMAPKGVEKEVISGVFSSSPATDIQDQAICEQERRQPVPGLNV